MASLLLPDQAGYPPPRFPLSLGRLGRSLAMASGLCGVILLIAAIAPPSLGASAPQQEPRSGWQEELRRMPIDAVCSNLKGQKLAPYWLGPLLARGNPDTIMSTGWTERNHPPFVLVPPINWSRLQTIDRSWNYHLNSWHPLHAVLKRHSQTSQREYLTFALEVAADWVHQHPYSRDQTLDGVEDFAWYDMAVGRRIPQLSYIIDAACRDGSININRLDKLWISLLSHFDYLSDDRNIKFHNNHGFYQALGQFFAAIRFFNFERLAVFRLQSIERLMSMIDRHFSSEGVHLEHSPEYHYSVLRAISTLTETGILEEIPSLSKQLGNMRESMAWMIMPSRKIVNFGDSDRIDFSRRRALLGGMDLLDHAITGGASGEATPQHLAAFPEAGLAVVKSDWADGEDFPEAAYLAQTGAFHSRVHKQADDLSFVWYDRGADILIDAGRYGYLGRTKKGSELWNQGFWYSDPKRVYVESTRAHNTVEIDGRSFDRKRSKPYGSALERWWTGI